MPVADATADGFFIGTKVQRATVDISRTAEPGVIDSTRTRPVIFAGWQHDTGLEFVVEYWQGSTGVAECRATTDPCPRIAVPTKARFLNATGGFEFFPAGGPFSLMGRVGLQHGRATFGIESRNKLAPMVGAGARYRVTQAVALGVDFSASSFVTRTAGLELRVAF